MGSHGSKIKVTETDKAMLAVKKSRDELHKFSKRTDIFILQEKTRLKELIHAKPTSYKSDPQVRALLKRIHYQEHLLQQASDQLVNLENMVATLEYKLVEKQFLEGLQNGNNILKKMNREFQDVDTLIDDVRDQIAYQNEVDQVLATSVTGTHNIEEELDRELELLNSELKSEVLNLPNTDGLASLPQVPVITPEEQAEHIISDSDHRLEAPLPS